MKVTFVLLLCLCIRTTLAFMSHLPLGLPQRSALSHGYLDDTSGLNQYREEYDLKGRGIFGRLFARSKHRRMWKMMPDFLGFVASLREKHAERFGAFSQFPDVTPIPINGKR